MPLRLPPHSHCRVCEEIIPEEEEFCSPECTEEQRLKDYAERQKGFTTFVAILFVMLGVFGLSIIL